MSTISGPSIAVALGAEAPEAAPVWRAFAAPELTVTKLAEARAPNLSSEAENVTQQVLALASRRGLEVRELVFRGDWSEEGDPELFRGVVLDIFVRGELGARLEFWEAATEAVSHVAGGVGEDLSVMVHAC